MPKILIADDHPLFRSGAKQFLLSEFDDLSVDEASSGQEVLDQIAGEADYDAVILDIMMPGLSGLEVLQRINSSHPEIPVLVLSMHDEDHYAENAIMAGASGYLVKEGEPRELTKALKVVIEGGKYFSAYIFKKLIAGSDPIEEVHEHKILSNRELQVMRMIASGMKLKEIAEELSLSTSAVSTHRTRILTKMRMKSNADIVRYAVRAGLVE